MSVVSPQQDQTKQEEGTIAQASSDVFGGSHNNRLDHELPIRTQREGEATALPLVLVTVHIFYLMSASSPLEMLKCSSPGASLYE